MNNQIASAEVQEDKAWTLYWQSQNITNHLQAQWRQLANRAAKLKFEEKQKQNGNKNKMETCANA